MTIVKEDRKSFIRYGYYDEEGDFVTHREDGPAEIYIDGRQCWYNHNEYHREDGPAVIYENGLKIWYNHDKIHREDGPAIIYADGDQRWYNLDTQITKEVNQWLKEHNIDNWENMSEEEKLALVFFMRSY